MRMTWSVLAGLLGAGVAAQSALAECRATETRVEGEPAVVLENSLVRLRVRPTRGGRVDQLVYKPTDKWLTAQTDGRVFVDRVWNYADSKVYRQWTNAVYAYKLESGGKEAAVTLNCRGSVGIGKRLTFEKRISLAVGNASVRADYTLGLGHEAMVPKRAGIWWHNQLGVPQEATTYYVPTFRGVRSLTYGAGASGQYWWYDLARGWGAALGTEGTGVAAVMDYRKLMCFYHNMRGEVAMMEWAYRSEEIPNDGSTKTTVWLVPFAGLDAVSGAGRDVVGQIRAPDKTSVSLAKQGAPVTVRLTAPHKWRAVVKMTWQRLPAGEAREFANWQTDLTPTSVAEKQLRVKLEEEGSYALRAAVMDGDTLAADLFAKVVVGQDSGELAIAPLEKRLGREGERFDDRIAAKSSAPQDAPPSEQIVTPHVKWAKPLASGSLKTLILNDVLIERETVELAQRVDMDYTAPTVGSYRRIGNARLPGRAFTFEQAQANVAKHLKREFDVVVISGVTGKLFTDDMADTLLRKVRDGMGLVWVNPNHCPDVFWTVLPFSCPPWGSRGKGKWQATEDHYLTTGIPWEEMPSVDLSRYKVAGRVLATAGNLPLLAVCELGKGRIVCLSYATSWQGPGFHKNGLTPWVQYAPTKFAYWEYYFSLLGKCMTWAAREEPAVQFRALAADATAVAAVSRPQNPGQAVELRSGERSYLKLTVANSGGAAELLGRVAIHDEYGHLVAELDRALRISPGESELSIPLPQLHGGLHLVDLILEDGAGAKVNWGTVPVHVQAPVMIAELEVADKVYLAGETVTARLTLKATGQAPGQVRIHAALTDAYGRLVWRGARTAAAGSRDCEIAFALPEPLATTAVLRAEVRDDRGLLHAAEQKILTMPPAWDRREWEPFSSTLWGNPVGAYSREYLQAKLAEQVRAVGIDAVLTTGRWTQDGEQRLPFELGFRTLPIGVSGKILSPGRRSKEHLSFAEQKAQYLRTRDKKHLERPWCLNADDTRSHVSETIAQIVPAAAPYRPLGYVCGDEVSVTDHTQPFDYDFSPPALAAFREWLGKEYLALPALNEVWDTNFASWDRVVPMTAEEVADRGTYAPWADHRTFMEISYADFLRFLDAELERHDPGARVGISGSQAAAAYGGYDWWRLTDAFDFIQAYDHQNTGEMHRSFHDMIAAPWWGYHASGSELRHQLWRRLLNGNRGASYFAFGSLLCGDYTYTRTITEGKEYIKEFKAGLARLLHGCAGRATDVYLHYSQSSIHGVFITGGEPVFNANRAGWIKIIEDSGLQMKFLSYAQVEDGKLTELMPRAFVLPYSLALSDTEAAQLRKYVEAGGTLVADARCGLLDEHCAPRSHGALDALFGVARTEVNPKAKRVAGDAVFTRAHGECDPRQMTFQDRSGETAIKVTDGVALGQMADTPVLIVRRAGKGKTVLVNLFMDSYARRRKRGAAKPLRQLVREVLDLAGVRPFTEVASLQGDHFYAARYLNGDASYVAILREPETILTGGGPGSAKTGKASQPSQVTVQFAQTAHLYDLREGEYLGRTDRAEKLLGPGDCLIYSLLPYRVEAIEVALDGEAKQAGERVSFSVRVKARGAKPGFHVFRVEVTGPDGAKEWYGTQISADAGSRKAGFELALNDVPGKWRIEATDIATGMTGLAELTVSGPGNGRR